MAARNLLKDRGMYKEVERVCDRNWLRSTWVSTFVPVLDLRLPSLGRRGDLLPLLSSGNVALQHMRVV